MTADLTLTHVFEPAPPPGDGRTLLLLHGTGGDERDMLGIGRALGGGAALLSPRGQVLENGMPRFFRRSAEGVFDEGDLRQRAGDLADFVIAASLAYHFDPTRVWAVGYSNGANIAASLLLLRPETLAGAVLWRATLPFEPEQLPALAGRAILLSEGRNDPFAPIAKVERLAALLRSGGADVSISWQSGGHQLTQTDLHEAQAWLAGHNVGPSTTP